eukprot:15443216-Alexandrium_andersonii.AAC.1
MDTRPRPMAREGMSEARGATQPIPCPAALGLMAQCSTVARQLRIHRTPRAPRGGPKALPGSRPKAR